MLFEEVDEQNPLEHEITLGADFNIDNLWH
jgi:hypothetical protein